MALPNIFFSVNYKKDSPDGTDRRNQTKPLLVLLKCGITTHTHVNDDDDVLCSLCTLSPISALHLLVYAFDFELEQGSIQAAT